jgi:hypothetical protein
VVQGLGGNQVGEGLTWYIRHTTTETGLKVKAFFIDWVFEKDRRVIQSEREAFSLVRQQI